MPTTSNFGWTTPADTDLVKDGAAAIRTLGNGVDSSFVDLKGGTTDQVLAKNSNTDLDFKWVTSDDANAIQNAIVDAKGDLISATAADTPARLAVGANGTILTADSSQATGLKWATPTAGGMTLISTTTLSGSSILLTSIPQTYKDLRIIIRNWLPNSTAQRYRMRVNGDSNTRYKQDLYLSSAPNSNYTFGFSAWDLEDRSNSSTSSSPNYGDFTLPDYTNSTTWKMVWGFSFNTNATTPTNFNFNNYMSIYNQTNAITSLEIFTNTSTFASGDVLLYGVN